ncbi:helix-turn-helix protein [Methanomicrobium sp. W14]|uniref:CheF family chemotaxis protein n=1 Tax=Methanomicrobium sp. W14 TaxID=2817839 RepID=UPI001AEB7817|nr:CheF family chemotaxis protein [Methanomicrobium sp. W14]MBP2132983.1 helix-turn-helix protein [Methanomicrobium sp. W14]
MTQLPVKLEQKGKWISLKINLEEDKITIPGPVSVDIKIKDIDDLEEKKSILVINTKKSEKIKLASIPKVLNLLKRAVIMGCTAYRLSAYFMSPAVRGGVMVKNSKWEKGAIAVLKTGIWFVSKEQQICIPLNEVSGIEITKREVQGRESDVVQIEHIESDEVVTSFVLCPLTTLQILFNYLKDATKELDVSSGELDGTSAQVAMLVYSGMDTHAIENMLSISNKQIESIYDKLIEKGLVEVVLVRREVKLTTKGVRFVNESVKT